MILLIISFLFTALIIKSNYNLDVALDDGDSGSNVIEPQAQKASNFFDVHKYHLSDEKIDWHNYAFVDEESERVGRGEHGKGDKLGDDEDAEYDALFKQNGYNAVLSDKISVNRSVKDIRHKE